MELLCTPGMVPSLTVGPYMHHSYIHLITVKMDPIGYEANPCVCLRINSWILKHPQSDGGNRLLYLLSHDMMSNWINENVISLSDNSDLSK